MEKAELSPRERKTFYSAPNEILMTFAYVILYKSKTYIMFIGSVRGVCPSILGTKPFVRYQCYHNIILYSMYKLVTTRVRIVYLYYV